MLGAKVATATKPEGEGTAGVIAFKASGAKLLQDKKGCGQAFCSTATHSAKAFPLTSLTPTQHPTSTLPQTSDGTKQGCFVPFVAVPHRRVKWPAWSGTPQT